MITTYRLLTMHLKMDEMEESLNSKGYKMYKFLRLIKIKVYYFKREQIYKKRNELTINYPSHLILIKSVHYNQIS